MAGSLGDQRREIFDTPSSGAGLDARGLGGGRSEVTMQIVMGTLLLVAGLAAMISALPLTHRIARVMPQWAFSRGDVERLASTTFLTAFIGLLGAIAGAALLLLAVVQH